MDLTLVNDLLKRNESFEQNDFRTGLKMMPSQKLIIISCAIRAKPSPSMSPR